MSASFDLREPIRDFIGHRDKLWNQLVFEDEPSHYDLTVLDTLNKAVGEMVSLEPGPTTKVLDPDVAKAEYLRFSVCGVFIARCIAGVHQVAQRTEDGHRNSAATVAEVFGNHALRSLCPGYAG